MNLNELRENVTRAFHSRYGKAPSYVVRAPGRVNIIGEHTDYNFGYVLPAAIDREIIIAAAPTNTRSGFAELYSLDYDEVDQAPTGGYINKAESPSGNQWANYFRGVLAVWQSKVSPVPPFHATISGNIPQGSGLSSSAAFELALACLLNEITGARLSAQELASLAHQAETEFVGVKCGIMDQYVSALGQPDQALFLNCLTRESTLIPVGLEAHALSLLVVDSGVRRNLHESRYNMRPLECGQALSRIREILAKPGLLNLSKLTGEELASCADRLPDLLFKRTSHVVEENARVLAAIQAIRLADFAWLGDILNASHASLRDNYEVSCAEVDILVSLAQAHPGVLGARMTGAGFGGSIVAIIETSAVPSFATSVLPRYEQETGKIPHSHACRISAGATVIVPEAAPFPPASLAPQQPPIS